MVHLSMVQWSRLDVKMCVDQKNVVSKNVLWQKNCVYIEDLCESFELVCSPEFYEKRNVCLKVFSTLSSQKSGLKKQKLLSFFN